MPTIEGKQAGIWINDYLKKSGEFEGVAKAVRTLMQAVKGVEEYVNPWSIPSFDSNGPLCCFMVGKEHVTFAFMRGAALPDPEKLLEGTQHASALLPRARHCSSLSSPSSPGWLGPA